MQLTSLDWSVVALYFLFNLCVGLYYRSRAKLSVDEFFLSGRNVPWWLAGTSMVAAFFVCSRLLRETEPGLGLLAIAAVGILVIYRDFSRRGWGAAVE